MKRVPTMEMRLRRLSRFPEALLSTTIPRAVSGCDFLCSDASPGRAPAKFRGIYVGVRCWCGPHGDVCLQIWRCRVYHYSRYRRRSPEKKRSWFCVSCRNVYGYGHSCCTLFDGKLNQLLRTRYCVLVRRCSCSQQSSSS